MLDLFSKLEVNMSMLVLIKQMSSYAKFLKELCTHKRTCKPNEKVQLGPNVSAMFKNELPVLAALGDMMHPLLGFSGPIEDNMLNKCGVAYL